MRQHIRSNNKIVVVRCRPALSIFFFALFVLITGCHSRKQQVVLQREWVANAEFAGDTWAAKLAQADGFDLQVREGSEVIDPVKMVRTHAVQFGVASSDRVLRENALGADLVVIAVSSYRSPVVFLSQTQLNVTQPSDFRNKKIGIQAGTNTELVFRALVATVPLSNSQMNVVDSGWGINTFEARGLDVMGAFAYDEPVQLDLKGIRYNTLDPEKFGVHFVGTVYFTSRDEIRSHPDVVQKFLDYLVAGWQKTLTSPEQAIAFITADFKDVDARKELLSLKKGIPYFQGEDGKLLYASPARWADMSKQLQTLGQLRQFSFADNVDYTFLNKAIERAKK